MWKNIDFWIDFSEFYRNVGCDFFACFTFGKEGKLQKNKRKKNKRKRNSAGKETLQSNANTHLGRQAGPGRILVACGNYPPRACKDRCMRKFGSVAKEKRLP